MSSAKELPNRSGDRVPGNGQNEDYERDDEDGADAPSACGRLAIFAKLDFVLECLMHVDVRWSV